MARNGRRLSRRELGDAILYLKAQFDDDMRAHPDMPLKLRLAAWDDLLVRLSKPLSEYYWMRSDGELTEIEL